MINIHFSMATVFAVCVCVCVDADDCIMHRAQFYSSELMIWINYKKNEIKTDGFFRISTQKNVIFWNGQKNGTMIDFDIIKLEWFMFSSSTHKIIYYTILNCTYVQRTIKSFRWYSDEVLHIHNSCCWWNAWSMIEVMWEGHLKHTKIDSLFHCRTTTSTQ